MTDYVINEWFWADLVGEQGELTRSQTFEAMLRFSRSTDKMIVVFESAFDRKAWALCKSHDLQTKRIGRAFVRLIRYDLHRCLLVYPRDLPPLPPEVAEQVKPDDRYLVQTCLKFAGSVLVTTDTPLAETIARMELPCLDRGAFVARFAS